MLTATKECIDSNTIIVEDFNTLFTSMDRSSRQEINKETQVLNDTLDQVDLTDIYKAFHPKAANAHSFFFFVNAHSFQVYTEHSPE